MSLKLLIAQFIRKQAIGCKISSCRRQLINNSRLHTKARNVYLNDLLGTAQIIRTFEISLSPDFISNPQQATILLSPLLLKRTTRKLIILRCTFRMSSNTALSHTNTHKHCHDKQSFAQSCISLTSAVFGLVLLISILYLFIFITQST